MNISLTPKLEKFIAEKVRGGLYRSASEVVRDGLRLLVQQDRIQKETLKSLHQDIRAGLDQLDGGETIDGKDAFSEVRRMSQARRNG